VGPLLRRQGSTNEPDFREGGCTWAAFDTCSEFHVPRSCLQHRATPNQLLGKMNDTEVSVEKMNGGRIEDFSTAMEVVAN
jgi:hypothetical protein